MIVAWDDLPKYSSQVLLVDGSFDPLHDGHIAYFEVAAAFGLPVLCNIATDIWTSGKHPVLLPQLQRARVIDSIRHIAYVHCAKHSTGEVLEQLKPLVYAKGADWRERGGIPPEEAAICARLGIEVKYLDTVLNSSSRLIERIRSV
jgi:bifunctional ADP-heptose synthase (sugar kinase/adenylyltransferase)